MLNNRRGQSTAEYAILIAVVIAAVVGMQLYVKRGMQAKFKNMSDVYTAQGGVVGATPIATTQQYEPYYTASGTLVSDTVNKESAKMAATGIITKEAINNNTTRTGSQKSGVTLIDDDAWSK